MVSLSSLQPYLLTAVLPAMAETGPSGINADLSNSNLNDTVIEQPPVKTKPVRTKRAAGRPPKLTITSRTSRSNLQAKRKRKASANENSHASVEASFSADKSIEADRHVTLYEPISAAGVGEEVPLSPPAQRTSHRLHREMASGQLGLSHRPLHTPTTYL